MEWWDCRLARCSLSEMVRSFTADEGSMQTFLLSHPHPYWQDLLNEIAHSNSAALPDSSAQWYRVYLQIRLVTETTECYCILNANLI